MNKKLNIPAFNCYRSITCFLLLNIWEYLSSVHLWSQQGIKKKICTLETYQRIELEKFLYKFQNVATMLAFYSHLVSFLAMGYITDIQLLYTHFCWVGLILAIFPQVCSCIYIYNSWIVEQWIPSWELS